MKEMKKACVCVDHGECSSWDIIHGQTMTKQAGEKFCGFLLIFFILFFFYTPFALKCEVYDRHGSSSPTLVILTTNTMARWGRYTQVTH